MHYGKGLIGKKITPSVKREKLLESIFGRSVPFGSIRCSFGDLPLYGIKEKIVTAKGFGGKSATKLKIPFGDFKAIVTGICLWDARWKVHFDTGAVIRPGIPDERALIDQNARPLLLEISAGPGEYPKRMIDFQEFAIGCIQRTNPRAVIHYHVPELEYLRYLDKIPNLPEAVRAELGLELAQFASRLRNLISARIAGKIEFVCPLLDNPEEVGKISQITGMEIENSSYLWPYVSLGQPVLGVEDLVEFQQGVNAEKYFRLSGNASSLSAVLIGSVLSVPHPYLFPPDLAAKKVRVS